MKKNGCVVALQVDPLPQRAEVVAEVERVRGRLDAGQDPGPGRRRTRRPGPLTSGSAVVGAVDMRGILPDVRGQRGRTVTLHPVGSRPLPRPRARGRPASRRPARRVTATV